MLPEKAGMLPERVVLLRRQPCDGRALRASRRQKLIRKSEAPDLLKHHRQLLREVNHESTC